MLPLKPEHADKTSPVAGAPGFAIKRVLDTYAYPNNGNLHNPTPQYRFLLLLDGRTVDQSERAQGLRKAAQAPGAREAYSDDETTKAGA